MRKVKVVETGEIFESVIACAEAIHASPRSIAKVCNGQQKAHMGRTYEWVESIKK